MAKIYNITAIDKNVQYQAALEDYYGAGITVHGIDTYYVVFSIPAISDKVFKIGHLYAYAGDAFTSGTVITNQVQALKHYTTNNGNPSTLILSENGFLEIYTASGNTFITGVFKLTDGKALMFGFTNSTSSTYYPNETALLLPEKTLAYLATVSPNGYVMPNGDALMFPLYAKDSAHVLMLDTLGNPVELLDLKVSSVNLTILDSTNVIVLGGTKTFVNNYGGTLYGTELGGGLMLPKDPA